MQVPVAKIHIYNPSYVILGWLLVADYYRILNSTFAVLRWGQDKLRTSTAVHARNMLPRTQLYSFDDILIELFSINNRVHGLYSVHGLYLFID